jgi:branched-subunit amino acid transport protein
MPGLAGWGANGETLWAVLTILGLAIITVVTRGLFLLSDRDWPLPAWLLRGLRYAPLAALCAVVAPDLVMTQGRLIDTPLDARLFAALAAIAYFFWKRGILGTILVGMAVYLPLRHVVGL